MRVWCEFFSFPDMKNESIVEKTLKKLSEHVKSISKLEFICFLQEMKQLKLSMSFTIVPMKAP